MKMKTISVIASLTALLALASCEHEDTDRQHYDNKLFISAASLTDEMLIDEADSYSRDIVAAVAKPESRDITVTFRPAPELVDNYKHAYYDTVSIALPDGVCRIDKPTTTILAGNVQSSPVSVTFENVLSLDRNQRYVMPVTIESVEGIGGVLRSAKTCYFLFRGASLINIVVDLSENRAWPEFGNFDEVQDMYAFTMEALVNPTTLNKTISTVMGIEDTFLIRMGDSGVDPSQLQVVGAASSKLTDESLKIPTGEWTHIAVTFECIAQNQSEVKIYLNGELKKEGIFYLNSINFAIPHSNESGSSFKRCFWVGYSFTSDRYFDGKLSELRIWNRALTADEIAAENHFYRVDPSSEGLVAYWKLDDGAGTVGKDYSPYGHDLTIESEPDWVQVELPQIAE